MNISWEDVSRQLSESSEYADAMSERLATILNEFNDELKEDEQVAILINGRPFLLEEVGYYNPSLVVFYGDGSGEPYSWIVQHISQINLQLVTVKRQNPAEPKKENRLCS